MSLVAIAGSAAYIDWLCTVMRRGEELCALLTLFKLSVTATSWPKRFIGYDCQILHRCQIIFDILYLPATLDSLWCVCWKSVNGGV